MSAIQDMQEPSAMEEPSVVLNALSTAMARAAPTDAQAFDALDHALRRFPGHTLFTVLAIDRSRNVCRRVYTSDPAAYPCGGVKPLPTGGDFFHDVILGGRARICADPEACRLAFADYALIETLGCRSAINVPVRHGGSTIGSMNLLHRQVGWYRPDMAPALASFAELAAPLLLRPQPTGMPSCRSAADPSS